MKAIIKTLQLLLVFIIVSCSNTSKNTITTGKFLNHIKYLSSDSLKGRLTGSPGDSLAAEYIKSQLKK